MNSKPRLPKAGRGSHILQYRIGGIALCSALLAPLAAVAAPQTDPAAVAAPQGDAPAMEMPQEIVVTAQRFAQDITKVPMSISALTGDQMAARGIKDIKDLAQEVPGLNFQVAGGGAGPNEKIAIRGVTSDTGAATTGIYINDTPVQTFKGVNGGTVDPFPKVFDLARVEVLKGPQGTLFGASSEGGTVRFITPDPSLTRLSGKVHAEATAAATGDPTGELGAAFGGPIIEDKLGFRVSGWMQREGGYVDRLDYRTGAVVDPKANWDTSRVANAALRLKATDRLTLDASVFYQETHINDLGLGWLDDGNYPGTASTPPPHGDTGIDRNLSLINQPAHDKFYLPSLTMDYAGDRVDVKLISSYFDRNQDQRFFIGNGDANLFLGLAGLGDTIYLNSGMLPGSVNYTNAQSNLSEELRFSSPAGSNSRLRWVGGMYWGHTTQWNGIFVDEADALIPNDPRINAAFGLTCAPGTCQVADLFGMNDLPNGLGYQHLGYLSYVTTRTRDLAGYLNASYKLTTALTLQVGARYGTDKFDFNQFQDGPWNAHLDQNGNLVGRSVTTGEETEHPVTPRVSVSYEISPGRMLYATAAKGFRVGGVNFDLSTLKTCQPDFILLGKKGNPLTYKSDSLWNYEIGSKDHFLNGALYVDASAFLIDWSNIQRRVSLPLCGYSYTDNLGHARSRGGELDMNLRLGGGFSLAANISYTDAEQRDTLVAGTSVLVKAGQSLGTPPLQFTISPQYAHPLRNDMSLYARADYAYASSYDRTGPLGTYDYDPARRHGLAIKSLSARIGVTTNSWDVALVGYNVLNSRTITGLYTWNVGQPGMQASTLRPRAVGISLDYRF